MLQLEHQGALQKHGRMGVGTVPSEGTIHPHMC